LLSSSRAFRRLLIQNLRIFRSLITDKRDHVILRVSNDTFYDDYKRVVRKYGEACPIKFIIQESCSFNNRRIIDQDIKNLESLIENVVLKAMEAKVAGSRS
jgi:hypothetical protein